MPITEAIHVAAVQVCRETKLLCSGSGGGQPVDVANDDRSTSPRPKEWAGEQSVVAPDAGWVEARQDLRVANLRRQQVQVGLGLDVARSGDERGADGRGLRRPGQWHLEQRDGWTGRTIVRQARAQAPEGQQQ